MDASSARDGLDELVSREDRSDSGGGSFTEMNTVASHLICEETADSEEREFLQAFSLGPTGSRPADARVVFPAVASARTRMPGPLKGAMLLGPNEGRSSVVVARRRSRLELTTSGLASAAMPAWAVGGGLV